MIIRGQSKNLMTNDMNLFVEEYSNKYAVSNKDFRAGLYSTEEKAIKVLDMIQEAYCKCESVKVLMCGSWEITKTVRTEDAINYAHEHRGTFIFQMPQDSEV